MQKSLGYEIEILHLSKRQVNVKLQSLVIQHEWLNREFDFRIRMDSNLDTNKLKPICQKN